MPAPITKPGKQRADLRRLVSANREMVEALDVLYPAQPPSLHDTDREVWFNAGARGVVSHLLNLLRESDQRGNILEN